MTDLAVRIEGLGKRYRIGEHAPYKTLRDKLTGIIHVPFRAWGSVMNGGGAKNGSRPSNDYIWALKDVSFEIKQGEVIGIIGRNGAGKTTLLKLLSRITEPTEGYAEIHGRVGSLVEVGTGFHPELTGRENIYLNGAILGMKKREIDNKFNTIVAFAGVEKFINTPVKRYSSGMYLRLGFSVAAHLEPEVLLVDEVLGVRDLGFQQKCIRKMDDISKAGRTVLVVSHNMRVIETLTNHCIYLKHGALIEYGPTLDIVKQYQRDSLAGPQNDDLPSQFDLDIKVPRMVIDNITVRGDGESHTNTVESGNSTSLSFDLEAYDDILQAVICVYFCKDKIVVSGNNSDHMVGSLSLKRGERIRFDIKYESLPFIPGDYSVLIFVLPAYFSRIEDTLSKFRSVKVVIKGSRNHGGGYVSLRQSWKVSPLQDRITESRENENLL